MIDVKIPSPGESITQVQLASWLVSNGQYVEKDDEIVEIDSDKASLSISAEESGKIQILAEEGDTLEVGAVVAKIDTDAKAPADSEKSESESKETSAKTDEEKAEKEEPKDVSERKTSDKKQTNKKAEKENITQASSESDQKPDVNIQVTPLAKQILKEKGIDVSKLGESIKNLKISKSDIENATSVATKTKDQPTIQNKSIWSDERNEERKKMTTLRKKITERLVSVKNETAMLTTFNEVNMEPVLSLRSKHKAEFQEKYGVKPGLMSFFSMAAAEALQHFPDVNARLENEEIIYHKYADIGIAVSTPKGLMVPVLRNVHLMSLAEIEHNIKEKADKARKGKLTLDEMNGGTFTITNGGVFGSMLSTPILNPPQSAILGMHNIQDRPVAIDGKVEIKPVMYIALSYDHRTIDGKDSVSFLIKIKELLENPVNMLFNGYDPEKKLLGL